MKVNAIQLILPKNGVREILDEIHRLVRGGHFGINKTLEKISVEIIQCVRNCELEVIGVMRQYNVRKNEPIVVLRFPVTYLSKGYMLVVITSFIK